MAPHVLPVVSDTFEQLKGADNIGRDEIVRSVNGAIDVGFRGEIDDRTWPQSSKQPLDQAHVTNVTVDKLKPGVRQPVKTIQVARIRQLVEIDDGRFLGIKPSPDEVRAYESGSAGDQYRPFVISVGGNEL